MLLFRKTSRGVYTIFFHYFEIYKKQLNFTSQISNVRVLSTSPILGISKDQKDFDYNKFRVEYTRNPSVRGSFTFLRGEFSKCFEEFREKFPLNSRQFEIRYPNQVDMVFTFDNENSLNNFVVTTDSAHDEGYSSASLKITQDKTALFSGHIDTTVPKTGNVKLSGYANMMSRRRVWSFGRPGRYDWTFYTHLVMKIRGDGRTYALILPTPGTFDIEKNIQFFFPLYTRGGPYWQLVRIPFSDFVFSIRGQAQDSQYKTVPLDKVTMLGITISDGNDGPFKLEIDYIGLESDNNHRNICPYEQYYVGKSLAT